MPRPEDNSLSSRRATDMARDSEIERLRTSQRGSARIVKKSTKRKILDTIMSKDIDEVGDYISHTVLGPGVKRLLWEAVLGSLSMIFWGDPRRGASDGRRPGDQSSYRSYNTIYDDRRRRNTARPAYSVEDIAFSYYEDAEDALRYLRYMIDRHGFARVADLYEKAQISPGGNYKVNDYGWFYLGDVPILPTENGDYVLDLPRCERR